MITFPSTPKDQKGIDLDDPDLAHDEINAMEYLNKQLKEKKAKVSKDDAERIYDELAKELVN